MAKKQNTTSKLERNRQSKISSWCPCCGLPALTGNAVTCPNCFRSLNTVPSVRVRSVGGFWLFGEPIEPDTELILTEPLAMELIATGSVYRVHPPAEEKNIDETAELSRKKS